MLDLFVQSPFDTLDCCLESISHCSGFVFGAVKPNLTPYAALINLKTINPNIYVASASGSVIKIASNIKNSLCVDT